MCIITTSSSTVMGPVHTYLSIVPSRLLSPQCHGAPLGGTCSATLKDVHDIEQVCDHIGVNISLSSISRLVTHPTRTKLRYMNVRQLECVAPSPPHPPPPHAPSHSPCDCLGGLELCVEVAQCPLVVATKR